MSVTTNFLDGIYIFYSPDCWTCEDHLESFEKNFSEFVLVNVESDRKFYESIGVSLVPNTRVYKDGYVIYEQSGMMFEKQMSELRKVL